MVFVQARHRDTLTRVDENFELVMGELQSMEPIPIAKLLMSSESVRKWQEARRQVLAAPEPRLKGVVSVGGLVGGGAFCHPKRGVVAGGCCGDFTWRVRR